MKQQFLRDLKYPFGNKLLDILGDPTAIKAINNVLKLAQERVWIARGKPEGLVKNSLMDPEFSDEISEYMLPTCERSIKLVQQLLDQIIDESQH